MHPKQVQRKSSKAARRHSEAKLCLAAFLAATLALPPQAAASSVTWTGAAGDNLYNSGSNWSGGAYPSNLTFDATVDPASPDFVNVNVVANINSLTVGANGTVNVLSGVALTLGSPSAPGASVLTNGGTLNIGNGAQLVLASSSDVTIGNTSALNLNSAGALTRLAFNSGNSAANFTIGGPGTLMLSDNAANSVKGLSGAEALINDFDHTISGAGTISGFSSFTNSGTLSATGTNALIVAAPLSAASWDGAGNLTGGTYNTSGNLQLNLGGMPITGLTAAAAVTLGGGLLTGDGVTNALSTLAAITDSSLTLNGQNQTITPAGGTLAVSTSGNIYNNNIPLASLNVTNANLTLNGELSNSAAGASSTIALSSGATLAASGGLTQTNTGFGTAATTVDSSTLTLGGAFTQDAQSALSLSNNAVVTAKGLNNAGLITIDATSSGDFRSGLAGGFANLSGGTLSGGTYNISGTLSYDADPVTNGGITALAAGANITLNNGGQMRYGAGAGTADLESLTSITDSSLSLYNSTLTSIAPVGGTLTIGTTIGSSSLLVDGQNLTVAGGISVTSSGLGAPATVTVQDGGTLNAQGVYSIGFNTTTAVSTTNGVGSVLTGLGFCNASGGEIDVDAGSKADFRTGNTGTFMNLTGGLLTGGSYNVAGALFYDANSDGGDIRGLQSATVTLTGTGRLAYGIGTGTQALSNLATISDSTLTLSSETSLNSVSGGLTISAVGDSSGLTLSGTNFTVNGDLNATSQTFVSAVNVQSGSKLTVTGSANISGNTTVSTGSSLLVNGSFANNSGSVLNVYSSTVNALGLTNNGSIVIDSGSKADFRTGAAGGFTNLSAGTLTGGSYDVAGKLLIDGNITGIASGTSLTLRGSGAIQTGGSNGGAQTSNAIAALAQNGGTLALNNGANLATASTFTNTGTVNILGGSTLTAATEYLQNAGSTTVTGTLTAATIDIEHGSFTEPSRYTNSGTFILGNGATANFTAATSSLGNLVSGSLKTGTWDIAGALTYSAGGKITDIGAAATLDLIGSGSIKTANANALSNLATVEGTLDISGGASLTTAAAFTNNGVVNITGGPGVDALTVNGQFTNKGTVTVGAGDTLKATGAGYVQNSGSTYLYGMLTASLVDIEGGSLFGTGGTISGSLKNAATVNPGDPGPLNVTGDYTQTAGGNLILDIAGATPTTYDNLAIGGNVNLNGTLDVNFSSAFLSSLFNGETFRLLTFNSGTLTGNFSTLEYMIDGGAAQSFLTSFNNGFTLQEIVNSHGITIEAVQAAPEPGTWMLIAAGLLLIGAVDFRRRKNTGVRLQ